ncbi:GGDEF domain-containing protein [Actinokineospora terrae]|uniref:Diguanylate cyclase (GGDEF) domain-containing protein n=1 Tax=Actinokineospora terrae TaxID=155974 RepID=A0A1H9KMB5_9PSEU|nr:GGDEF domain-containing protein [Actinokineospora terrae]SER00290.1 diguanylate cyclase (GGDEF) domain-containing protein [Actinokineospora terrae]
MGGIHTGSDCRRSGLDRRVRARPRYDELAASRFAGIPFALSRPVDGGLTGPAGAGRGWVMPPRRRRRWTDEFDRPTVAMLLGTDTAAVLAVVAAVVLAPRVSAGDWGVFLVLVACALTYTELTAASEQRRRVERARRGAVEFIDQASIWYFSAAVLLPPLLAAALVVAVRLRRYRISLRPAAVWVGSTGSLLLAVMAAGLVRGALTGPALPADVTVLTTGNGLWFGAVLVLAAVAYFVVDAAVVALYRGVRFHRWDPAATFGTREDNLLMAHTLLIALGAVVAAVVTPVALLAVLAVAVMETRMLGRLAARTADRDQLRVDATTDPLTGLRNRRGFDPAAAAVLAADREAERSTAVLMLDLDHFKRWNDRLTHFGGDQVLRAVADALRASTRGGDLLARWGGEELAVVLPDTTVEQAREAAERIRTAVRRLDTSVDLPAGGPRVQLGHDVPPCTVSIGVACAPEHGVALVDLQQLADRALGAAKRDGRDRVVVVGDEVPDPGSSDTEPR